MQLVKRFLAEDDAASMVEYGIMVALIAAVNITAVATLGGAILAQVEYVATDIQAETN